MVTLRTVKSDPEEKKAGIGIHDNGKSADQHRDSRRGRSMAELAGPKVKFVEPHRQVRSTVQYVRGAES